MKKIISLLILSLMLSVAGYSQDYRSYQQQRQRPRLHISLSFSNVPQYDYYQGYYPQWQDSYYNNYSYQQNYNRRYARYSQYGQYYWKLVLVGYDYDGNEVREWRRVHINN